MIRSSLLVVGIAAGLALPGVTFACSPPPPGYVAPVTSQAQVDAAARETFRQIDFIAQVVVERSPRLQLLNERTSPPPGRLRVIAAVKGSPPTLLELPSPDPCLFYFQTVGERLIVLGRYPNQPRVMPQVQVLSLRRQRLGNWFRVHH